MTVRVRSVVRYVAECTAAECGWRQLHDGYESACADAKRQRVEVHPRPSQGAA